MGHPVIQILPIVQAKIQNPPIPLGEVLVLLPLEVPINRPDDHTAHLHEVPIVLLDRPRVLVHQVVEVGEDNKSLKVYLLKYLFQ